jgi:hypothetical protein
MPKYRLNRILADLVTLRAFTKHVEEQSASVLIDGAVKEYWFSEIAIDADDDDLFIKPDDILVDDPGRWVLISPGGGAGVGTQQSAYQGVANGLADGVPEDIDVEAQVGELEVTLGLGFKIQLSATVAGLYKVELFEDAARAVKIATSMIDTSEDDTDSIPFGFRSDGDTGILYSTVTPMHGGADADVVLNVKLFVVAAVGEITQTTLAIAAAAVPGLEQVGGLWRVKVNGHIKLTALGIDVQDTVVVTDGDQDIAGAKRFSGIIGQTPHPTDAGAPTAGTYEVGDKHTDVDGREWRCLVAGTPGTWVFYGSELTIITGSVTTVAAAGGSEFVGIPMVGRRGIISRLRAWAEIAAQASFGVTGRIRGFSKETGFGRDQLWPDLTTAYRKVQSAAAAAAGLTSVEVASLGDFNAGDLLFLDDGTDTEINRLQGTLTAPLRFSLDDELLNNYAITSSILSVEEKGPLPWHNDSETGGEENKLFLEFINDDPTLALDEIFYELVIENLGGQQA